jgi:site-specific DNA recombinase
MAQVESYEQAAPATALKRAVIYLRVSTSRQANKGDDPEGYSLPAQREACLWKAHALGAEVVEEYIDKARSATTAARPQFQAMLSRIRTERDVDYVICDKVDRFARDRRDDANIMFELKACGAQLVSVKENIDDTPSGQLLHAIMAGFAEFYSRNLGAEALKGMTQKAKRGGTNGRAPIGYTNIGRRREDGREVRSVAVDPDRAPLVQWAFEAYATGEWTLTTLTEALCAKGLRTLPHARNRTPALVQRSAVAHMLSSRYYIGVIKFQGNEYEGQHQPLISRGVFDEVQEVLRSRRVGGNKTRKHQHYLRGTLFCAECGSRLCFTRAKGHGGEYDYFFCVGRQQKRTGCRQPFVRVDAIEVAIEGYYRDEVRIPTDVQKTIGDGLLNELEYQRSRSRPEILHARKRVTQLAEERRRLSRAVVTGAVSEDDAPMEQARIAQELRQAERILETAEQIQHNIEGTLETALDLLSRCDEAYASAGPTVRRQFNQLFFKKLLIRTDEVEDAEFEEPWESFRSEEVLKQLARSAKAKSARSSSRPGLKIAVLAGPPGLEPSRFLPRFRNTSPHLYKDDGVTQRNTLTSDVSDGGLAS